MRNEINLWWESLKNEYSLGTENKFEAFSKRLLLDWLNKILFCHMIKRTHSIAKNIEDLDFNSDTEEAIKIFSNITSKSDFHNIFKENKYLNLISKGAWTDIISFSKFLESNYIEEFDPSFLQNILENTINISKRLLNGQYTTPKKLAKLLVGLSLDDLTGHCLDPCCGTGTITKEIINHKIDNGIRASDALEKTWASDRFSFVLQISNLNMINKNTINTPAKIFKKNALELNINEKIKIVNPKNGELLNFNLPCYKNIVSNLPFIESNNSAKINKKNKTNIINNVYKNTDVKLSKKSDLYMFIIFHLWNILQNEGKLGVIISNSWLGTAAGEKFFHALKYYYNIDGIYINSKGRWFKKPDVVTSLVILTKKEISEPDNNHEINFSKIYKRLEDLDDEKLNKLIAQTSSSEDKYPNLIKTLKYNYAEVNNFLSMNVSLNSVFYKINWLLKIKSKLIPLDNIFNVFRGKKTGKNSLFYFNVNEDIPVDHEFLIGGIKDLRNSNNLLINKKSLNKKVFYCTLKSDNLDKNKYKNTIEWIENNKTNLNKSLNKRVETGKEWYDLRPIKKASLITTMNPDQRLFVAKTDQFYYIDQRIIGLKEKNKETDLELIHALLNSILGMFYIEAIGFGRGLGVLDMTKDNYSKIFMLNPDLVNKSSRKDILQKFNVLLNREVENCRNELEREDRYEFDIAVLKAYNIEGYYDDIKTSLLKMQNKRLSNKKN